MVVYAFHFHQTKHIYPCKPFLAILERVFAKKIAILFSQGVIFLISAILTILIHILPVLII